MLHIVCLAWILLNCVNAEHTVRCNNNTISRSSNSVTLERSPDGVEGRYVLQWCTTVVTNVTDWKMHIYYNSWYKPDQCKHYSFLDDKKFRPHSMFDENTHFNCSQVCFVTSVDLIFEACYIIKNQLSNGANSMESYDQLVYIRNNFTNFTTISEIMPLANTYNYDDHVLIQWFLGPVPAAAAHYFIELFNNTAPEAAAADVTQNCTGEAHAVKCELRVPPGSYNMLFTYRAPWIYGGFARETVLWDFNRTSAEAARPELRSGAAAWGAPEWSSAGCGVLALALLAALLLRRARRPPPSKPPASQADAAANAAGEAGAAAGASGLRVLLLYARDCPQLLAVARRLAELLQHVAPAGVYDLYSAAVSAQAARAPNEWLRALLAREDVRVVLLQTPAAHSLYAAQLRQRGHTLALEQPLLGSRAAPRRPHCADPLLQLALRLMCEGALPHHYPYRKFYVAEISGLEADVVPLVTPQRRYVLPAATPLLLQHLSASAPPAGSAAEAVGGCGAPPVPGEQLAQFSSAVSELQQYVRDNPDYLDEELIFL